MNYLYFIICLFIFLPELSSAQNIEVIDSIEGVGKYQWTMPEEDVKCGLKSKFIAADTKKTYECHPIYEMGGNKVFALDLSYTEGELRSITVNFDSSCDYNEVLSGLKKKYGNYSETIVTEGRESFPGYKWIGKKVGIHLDYSFGDKTATLQYYLLPTEVGF